jgi:hypothetical protein
MPDETKLDLPQVDSDKITMQMIRDTEQGWHRRTVAGETTDRRHHASREPAPASEERIEIGEHALHIFQDDEGSDWCVWLNTKVSDFDGLILAMGADRQQAVERAVAVVEALEAALQGPRRP